VRDNGYRMQVLDPYPFPPSTADPSSPDGLRDEQLANTVAAHSRYFGDGRVQHYTDDGTLLAEFDHYRSQWSTIEPMGPTNTDQIEQTGMLSNAIANSASLNIPVGGSLPSGSLPPTGSSDVSSLSNVFNEYISTQQFFTTSQAVQWHNIEPSSLQANWTLDRIPQMDSSGEPIVKKKKVYKIKLNVTNDEIAKAITKHTKERSKTIIHQADIMEAQITQEEQVLMQKQRMLANAKNRVGFYKAQKKRLSQSKGELAKDMVQAIENIKQFDNIQGVALDGAGRIIITTTPLNILKPGWKKAKVAGVYQIRIDFSRSHIHEGVRVLNTTQRASNQYDSPTISGTRCCWGNIARDVERDFYSQNIEELVLDMLEYIGSTNEQHGYLGLKGDKNKGWEQFFADAQMQPEKFDWEAYDRSGPRNEDEPLLRDPRDPVAIEPNIFSQLRQGGDIAISAPSLPDQETDRLRRNMENAQEERNDLLRRLSALQVEPRNPYENELYFGLSESGLREESVDHFFRHFREGRPEIYRLHIEQIGSHSFEIIAARGNETDRIVVDERDLKSAAHEAIRRGERRHITLMRSGFIDILETTRESITLESGISPLGPEAHHTRIPVPRQPSRGPQYYYTANSDINAYTSNATAPSQLYNNIISSHVTAGSTGVLTQDNLQALIRMVDDQIASPNTATGLEALQRAEGQAVLGLRNDEVNPVSGLQESNELTEEASERIVERWRV
jgi:hypothetical protein